MLTITDANKLLSRCSSEHERQLLRWYVELKTLDDQPEKQLRIPVLISKQYTRRGAQRQQYCRTYWRWQKRYTRHARHRGLVRMQTWRRCKTVFKLTDLGAEWLAVVSKQMEQKYATGSLHAQGCKTNC